MSQPEDVAAARAAARKNAASANATPLLAWAGLAEQTTAQRELERRIAALTDSVWQALGRAERDVQRLAEIVYLRFEIATVLGVPEADRIASWIESIGGPVYASLGLWRSARARALEGSDPVPEAGYIRPSACWPSLREALDGPSREAEGEAWRAALAEHRAAGCRREWCAVRQSGEPPEIFLGGQC